MLKFNTAVVLMDFSPIGNPNDPPAMCGIDPVRIGRLDLSRRLGRVLVIP